jgi:hypothetical protein
MNGMSRIALEFMAPLLQREEGDSRRPEYFRRFGASCYSAWVLALEVWGPIPARHSHRPSLSLPASLLVPPSVPLRPSQRPSLPSPFPLGLFPITCCFMSPIQCPICHKKYTQAKKLRHERSSVHKNAVAELEAKLEAQAKLEAESQLKFSDARLNQFFNNPSESLKVYSVAFGKLLLLGSQEANTEHGQPLKISAAQCWVRKPPNRDDLMDELLKQWDIHSSNREGLCRIFSRQDPKPKKDAPLATVLRQLYQPEEHGAHFAIDIPGGGEADIPEMLRPKVLRSNAGTMSNITPAFTYVAPHNDHCDSSLASIQPVECEKAVKIWASFPPTEHNLKVLETYLETEKDTFLYPIEKHQGYEKGTLTIQDEKTTIIIPPGHIHSTFTLYGCVTTGITFSTEASLEQEWTLQMDMRHHKDPSMEPFIRALRLAIAYGEKDKASDKLCQMIRYAKSTLKRDEITNILRQIDKFPEGFLKRKCPCKKDWKHH